ncbi:MAG: hypothetical protein KJ954_14140, partial [Alphaproteobacteria bacterium]|nr:hypothetical protein [Alphaproteobacteria bacterium]
SLKCNFCKSDKFGGHEHGCFILTGQMNGESKDCSVMEFYARQMSLNHAKKIEENLYLVVKNKPIWMPSFVYKAVIKRLVEFYEYRI